MVARIARFVLVSMAFGPWSVETLALGSDEIAFPVTGHIRGTSLVLDEQPTCIVVGETHGTLEIPLMVSALVRSASAERKTVLCLEIPGIEEARISRFLQSDGEDGAVSGLLSGPHWSTEDGRAGEGHFALIELCRRLVADGQEVEVAAIDIDPSELPDPHSKEFSQATALGFARKRDLVMAKNVETVVKENAKANVVVLVGNIHARLKAGMPWDNKYKPMAHLLNKSLPRVLSLDARSAGGKAWVSTDEGVGPRQMSGEDRGEIPFVEKFDRPKNGYSGVLYVGKITAASPAGRDGSHR